MNVNDLVATYRRERGGSIREATEGVRQLSPMFNGIFPHRPGYLASRSLRRAYVLYYFPGNVQKVVRVLAELDPFVPPDWRPRVLDFGCGPGTASVAFLLRRKAANLCLVDVVDEALDDAAFFTRQLGAEPRLDHAPPPGEKFDLILASNVFSETTLPLDEWLSDEGYMVVIEPALKGTTRKLMEWRDDMVTRGYRVIAPCVGAPQCPMRAHEDLWCHQDVGWERPSTVALVDDRLGLLKDSLKYAYMIVTRGGHVLEQRPGEWRVVSNLHKEKGKAWAWLCGRQGPLCRMEVLTRHRGPATAAFFHASRGDVLSVEASGAAARSEGPISRVR